MSFPSSGDSDHDPSLSGINFFDFFFFSLFLHAFIPHLFFRCLGVLFAGGRRVALESVPPPTAELVLPDEVRFVSSCFDFDDFGDLASSGLPFREGRRGTLAFFGEVHSEIAPTPVVPLDLPFELRVFTPIAEFGGMELSDLPRRFTPFWNAFVLLVMSRFVVLVRAIVGGWAIDASW